MNKKEIIDDLSDGRSPAGVSSETLQKAELKRYKQGSS